jgi:polyisoprenoid-binding protein YceI
MRFATVCLFALTTFPSLTLAQAPVFKVLQEGSQITFSVKSSVSIDGHFNKWDATFTVKSTDPLTGHLDIEIQAASVDTGSGMKNGKLKGKDFFDADHDPVISFKQTDIKKVGPGAFDITGDFTIRGVSKKETLKFTSTSRDETGGVVEGTMAFDRKDYGIDGSIPFIKIADRVEVTVHLKAKRVSGPRLDIN